MDEIEDIVQQEKEQQEARALKVYYFWKQQHPNAPESQNPICVQRPLAGVGRAGAGRRPVAAG
eukprot:SAG22_NODE_3654_length_1592_cov_2.251842_1_plen_62_part_10